jgi:ABC-type oligopeptide transport system ATPase subunit
MTVAALVEAKDLTRVFDVSKPWLNRVIEGERKAYLKAVTGVSFAIGRRETVALVGESGSGKSTVARMTVGLLSPTAGSVSIDGSPPHMIDPPTGCPFHPRCPIAEPQCERQMPPIERYDQGREVACWRAFVESIGTDEPDLTRVHG